MDPIVGEALSHETVTIEPLVAAASRAVAARLDSRGSPKQEGLGIDPHAKSLQAAVEHTTLIPARPKTPCSATRASDGFTEDADAHLFLSTAPHLVRKETAFKILFKPVSDITVKGQHWL